MTNQPYKNPEDNRALTEAESRELSRKGTRKIAGKTLPAILDEIDENLLNIANALRRSEQAAKEAGNAAAAAVAAAAEAGLKAGEAKAIGQDIHATAKRAEEVAKEAIGKSREAGISSDEARKTAEAALRSAREEAERAVRAAAEAKRAAEQAAHRADEVESKITQAVGVAGTISDLTQKAQAMIDKSAAEEAEARARMIEAAKAVLKSFLTSWQFVAITLSIIIIAVSIAVALGHIK